MPQSDQGVTRNRYTIIPRTAIFLRRGDSPFSALSYYDAQDKLIVEFGE